MHQIVYMLCIKVKYIYMSSVYYSHLQLCEKVVTTNLREKKIMTVILREKKLVTTTILLRKY